MDEYEPLETIGYGSFGRVAKIRRRADNRIFVWKEMDFGKMTDKEKQFIVTEVNILRSFRHPYIVRYYDRIIDRESYKIYIVMEYCENGDLAGLIKRNKIANIYPDERQVWRIALQLCLALEACHTRKEAKVLHRDIKPANVLLDADNVVKLGDFGLARTMSEQSAFAHSNVGTPYYMSPEQIRDQGYDEKTDVWGLGCVLYEFSQNRPPFEATNQLSLAMKIKAGKYKEIKGVSQELARLIGLCLTADPARRPSIEELLAMPCLSIRLKEKKLSNHYLELKRREEEVEARAKQLDDRERAVHAREADVARREQSLKAREEAFARQQQQQQQQQTDHRSTSSPAATHTPQPLRRHSSAVAGAADYPTADGGSPLNLAPVMGGGAHALPTRRASTSPQADAHANARGRGGSPLRAGGHAQPAQPHQHYINHHRVEPAANGAGTSTGTSIASSPAMHLQQPKQPAGGARRTSSPGGSGAQQPRTRVDLENLPVQGHAQHSHTPPAAAAAATNTTPGEGVLRYVNAVDSNRDRAPATTYRPLQKYPSAPGPVAAAPGGGWELRAAPERMAAAGMYGAGGAVRYADGGRDVSEGDAVGNVRGGYEDVNVVDVDVGVDVDVAYDMLDSDYELYEAREVPAPHTMHHGRGGTSDEGDAKSPAGAAQWELRDSPQSHHAMAAAAACDPNITPETQPPPAASPCPTFTPTPTRAAQSDRERVGYGTPSSDIPTPRQQLSLGGVGGSSSGTTPQSYAQHHLRKHTTPDREYAVTPPSRTSSSRDSRHASVERDEHAGPTPKALYQGHYASPQSRTTAAAAAAARAHTQPQRQHPHFRTQAKPSYMT